MEEDFPTGYVNFPIEVSVLTVFFTAGKLESTTSLTEYNLLYRMVYILELHFQVYKSH